MQVKRIDLAGRTGVAISLAFAVQYWSPCPRLRRFHVGIQKWYANFYDMPGLPGRPRSI